MHELKNGELQEVSGGLSTSIFGIIAGYNQFNRSSTIGGGLVAASLDTVCLMAKAPNNGVALLMLAIMPVPKTLELFLAHCIGTGVAYNLGRLED